MTPLAARLADRELSPADEAHRDLGAGTIPLADLRPGQSARIAHYAADLPANYTRRLHDLGFAQGAEVHVVRRAPALDPWIYRVANVEIALRQSLSCGILVNPK